MTIQVVLLQQLEKRTKSDSPTIPKISLALLLKQSIPFPPSLLMLYQVTICGVLFIRLDEIPIDIPFPNMHSLERFQSAELWFIHNEQLGLQNHSSKSFCRRIRWIYAQVSSKYLQALYKFNPIFAFLSNTTASPVANHKVPQKEC